MRTKVNSLRQIGEGVVFEQAHVHRDADGCTVEANAGRDKVRPSIPSKNIAKKTNTRDSGTSIIRGRVRITKATPIAFSDRIVRIKIEEARLAGCDLVGIMFGEPHYPDRVTHVSNRVAVRNPFVAPSVGQHGAGIGIVESGGIVPLPVECVVVDDTPVGRPGDLHYARRIGNDVPGGTHCDGLIGISDRGDRSALSKTFPFYDNRSLGGPLLWVRS